MKKCIKCGADIEDNSVFCEECGAKQEIEAPIAPIKEEKNEPPQNAYKPITESIETVAVDNAISNDASTNLTIPQDSTRVEKAPSSNERISSPTPKKIVPQHPKGKNKTTAGVLGLLLGHLGVNWFYLGKPIRGLIYLAFTVISFIVLMPVALVFTAFCMGEGIFMLCAKEETYKKYIDFTIKKNQ